MSLCGVFHCEECGGKKECGGCQAMDGHPFGGTCVAAECVKWGGLEEFQRLQTELISEINGLGIQDLEVSGLNLLSGVYVNLEYPLASGQTAKLLADNRVYLGNQIKIPGSEKCYGIAADDRFVLICAYGRDGADPEIILYKRRGI